MTKSQRDLIEKARESLTVARSLHESRHYELRCIQKLLRNVLPRGSDVAGPRSAAVTAAFGKELAKTGNVPSELHRYLIDAERSRIMGDYSTAEHVGENDSTEHLRQAEEFLKIAEALLSRDEPNRLDESH